MQVKRELSTKTLTLDHSRAIKDFLTINNYDSLNPASVPMQENWVRDDSDLLPPESAKRFRSHLASIAYWALLSRPDLSASVNKLCRYMSNPNESCHAALKQLVRYLKGTSDMGIKYHHNGDSLKLECFCDSSWGGDYDVMGKSTTGYVCYFGGGPISWGSSLQSIIAQSSTESELVAAFTASTIVTYHREFLTEIGLSGHHDKPTTLWEDNTSCIALSKNPGQHKRTRHILLKYFYIRHKVADGTVRLEYVATTDQIADIFTKALARKLFLHHRNHLVHRIS